ncbi:hypothetical protein COLO4_12177 [Corchorus olitorius]|uniref:Uncharacterized protein n=1 Tax=Corchorus olitorius TaxID=93759 RepID=A0A1R3K1W4_9ROSI|nr:hypothetical protein COLO4_12177 [Corchorus olitorius]
MALFLKPWASVNMQIAERGGGEEGAEAGRAGVAGAGAAVGGGV